MAAMREFFSLLGTALLVSACFLGIFLFGVGVGASEVDKGDAVVTAVAFPCSSEDACHVDYRHGAWWIDDQRMPVDCPEEDSCAADYRDGAWHVSQTPDDNPTSGETLTGPEADDWANTSDPSGRMHIGCTVVIGDTSVGSCPDGYTFSS